jgi:hypothetical protein
MVENDHYDDLYRHTAFVAIKNGQHNGVGYFADTGVRRARDPLGDEVFPLREIPARIIAALSTASG